MINPILVSIHRGDMVESFCRGSFVVVDASGTIIDSMGDIDRLIYPRSSLKPLQAMGMMLSGAAAEYKVTLEEIALACASHNGEEAHVNVVNAWLNRLGLDESYLACGPHSPMGKEAAMALRRSAQHPTRLHNTCSGKHVGFLTVAKFLGHDLSEYADIHYPTQQYITSVISEMVQTDVILLPKGIDGCQAPVLSMSLRALAFGMAQLSDSKKLSKSVKTASKNIVQAMQTYPHMVAGSGRFCTEIIKATQGTALVKMGAEGVFSGCIPEKGLGIALKIDDGRLIPAEVAMMAVLDRLKVIDLKSHEKWSKPVIKNWNHEIVGKIEAAF